MIPCPWHIGIYYFCACVCRLNINKTSRSIVFLARDNSNFGSCCARIRRQYSIQSQVISQYFLTTLNDFHKMVNIEADKYIYNLHCFVVIGANFAQFGSSVSFAQCAVFEPRIEQMFCCSKQRGIVDCDSHTQCVVFTPHRKQMFLYSKQRAVWESRLLHAVHVFLHHAGSAYGIVEVALFLFISNYILQFLFLKRRDFIVALVVRHR